jgi:hypothetical protein
MKWDLRLAGYVMTLRESISSDLVLMIVDPTRLADR